MREYMFFCYFWCNFVVNCSNLGLWVYFSQAIPTYLEIYLYIFAADQSQSTYPVPR